MVLSVLLLTAFCACRPDTVTLTYRYEPGSERIYRLDATARATWDIAGMGRGSYHATFYVKEKVTSSRAGGAVLSVSMTPTRIRQNGLPPPASQNRSFAVRVTNNGRVLEVLNVNGVPARALAAEELLFIGAYRPPLPLRPVALTDQWRSRQNTQLSAISQRISSVGRLESLAVDAHGELAEMSYSGSGPLVWRTELPQGAAGVAGSARSSSSALLDMDGGYLRRAASSTRGSFRVSVAQKDEATPLIGTMQLELRLRVESLQDSA